MATRAEVIKAIDAFEAKFGYMPNAHDMQVIRLVLELTEELA